MVMSQKGSTVDKVLALDAAAPNSILGTTYAPPHPNPCQESSLNTIRHGLTSPSNYPVPCQENPMKGELMR